MTHSPVSVGEKRQVEVEPAPGPAVPLVEPVVGTAGAHAENEAGEEGEGEAGEE